MDRLSRKLLKYMLSKPDPGEHVFNLQHELPGMADYAGESQGNISACLKDLADRKVIEFSAVGKHTVFKLSHRALHKNEFTWRDIGKYLLRHWIDIAALIIAGTALAHSIATRSMMP